MTVDGPVPFAFAFAFLFFFLFFSVCVCVYVCVDRGCPLVFDMQEVRAGRKGRTFNLKGAAAAAARTGADRKIESDTAVR